MRPSHPAGVVAMRKAPLDQRASLPEQALAIGPVHPLPVGVDGPLLLLLALPVPLPPLLLLRNIRSYFRPLHRAAMVTLVRDHFFDAVHVHLRFLVWRFLRFLGNQLRY